MKHETRTALAFTRHNPRTADAALVTIGSVVLDIHVTPNGRRAKNKHDAQFVSLLGGAAFHGGCFGSINGIRTSVIAVQKAGWASQYCRELAAQFDLRLILHEREEGPAVSMITPNGQPGRKDIYTQRMSPLTVNELTQEMNEALALAQVVIVGPPRSSPEVRDLLFHIPALAPQAFLALLPHPSLLQDPLFPLLARRYRYVQINADESRFLDGAVNDPAINARRLCFLVGEETACAVTNGPNAGFLWADGRWHEIQPKKVGAIDDTACGDAFAAAFLVGWRFLGLGVAGALHYAVEAAAATATQIGLGKPLPYRMVGIPA